MNLTKTQLSIICLSLIGFTGFSQEIKSPTLVKVEENGVAVYKSAGYETKSTKETNSERKVKTLEGWTLDECLSGLETVNAKIEHCQELGNMNEVNHYTKEKERISTRINILTKNIEKK